MCGYSNNRCNSQACTILLIIVILANQGLLDGSSKSKNALTLLFLYWLCGFNGGCGSNNMLGNCNYGSMCGNQCSCRCGCGCQCKCKCCKCKCKEKKCKCKRIKVCCA
ncbi:hypothetical protein [Clostridium sp. UBA5119]|uniref:hypothetical protein n=1 Tax=Clostridium sp. UBA5119 TaxID=1946366 RepID=UPI003216F3E2